MMIFSGFAAETKPTEPYTDEGHSEWEQAHAGGLMLQDLS